MESAGDCGASVVVALGASNTAGYGVGEASAYPAHIGRLLSEMGHRVRVFNAGVSGDTTGEMLARLDSAVPSGTRVVLFQPGGNDERRGIPDAIRERNIAAMINRLEARGISVIRVAAAFETARPGNLQSDGVHFTEAGHQLIARLLVDRVAAAL